MESNKENEVLRAADGFKTFLLKPFTNDDISVFFKELPVQLAEFIKIGERCCKGKRLAAEGYFSAIVHLKQYISTCELFKIDQSLNSNVDHKVFLEVKRCVCTQLLSLLDNVATVLEGGNEIAVGSFLNLMDSALDAIATIDVKTDQNCLQSNLNNVSLVVEEILCLSMSVAQVAFGDDTKIITASCHTVLNAVENVKTEINRENRNIAMCNLVIDTCTDTLCAFEARVNTAVLRLCLKVFSDYKKPIQTLYDACLCLDEHNEDALDPLIANFDFHMDRIFQIGMFSIASSAMGKGVADIKNTMTNLEQLEGELVPAFIAVVKDSASYRKVFANILKKSWCAQVKQMRKAIHGIIEPTAYCKLVYDELVEQIEDLWQHISAGKHVQDFSLNHFVSYTQELGLMFIECLDSFNSDVRCSVQQQLKSIYNVLNELTAARNALLKEVPAEQTEVNRRIFKRCKILVITIKRLWLCTREENGKNEVSTNGKDNFDQNTVVISSKRNTVNEEQALDNIINKSRQMLKDRSMSHFNRTIALSRTLQKSTAAQFKENTLNCTTKASNLKEFSYCRDRKLGDKDKDITIAEELNDLFISPSREC